jgi:octaprenyl-diphosphate synthase
LQEKKMTLPLIHALRETPKRDRRSVLKIVRKQKKSRSDIREVAQFVEERGGIAYAREKMRECAMEARDLLGNFPPNRARDAMLSLVDYTVSRSK